MMPKFLTERTSIVFIWIGLGIIALATFVFMFRANLWQFNSPIDSERFDHYGSLLSGLVGSIWTLASIILFYVALKDQRKALDTSVKALDTQIKEFELQRVELKLTRTELERTAKAQESSEKALADQAESLHITAELNALNTILQGKIAILNTMLQRGGSGQPQLKEVEDLISKIEALSQINKIQK